MSVKFGLKSKDQESDELRVDNAKYFGATLVLVPWQVLAALGVLIALVLLFLVLKPEKAVVAPMQTATSSTPAYTPAATFTPTPTSTSVPTQTPSATLTPTATTIPLPEWVGFCWSLYQLDSPFDSQDEQDWLNWSCATQLGQNWGILPYRGDSWGTAQSFGVYLNGRYLPEGDSVDIERCEWDSTSWCIALK